MLTLDRPALKLQQHNRQFRENKKVFLGRIGSLITRLATTKHEVEAAQELRYKVFFENRHKHGNIALSRRTDHDDFDALCDHLIVIDTNLTGSDAQRIVGTYRFLPQKQTSNRFYSANEFDVDGLIAKHKNRNFLELGRSCVLEPYRSKRTAELLWQGIWAYSLEHNIDVLMGCASFPGTIPAAHAKALSFLHHYHQTTDLWRVKAVPERSIDMDLMPQEAINLRDTMSAMPPLIKGYIRIGAKFGEGCVVDYAFGTVDVFVVLPTEMISQKYIRHYGADAQRFAA